jgi:hypothetical protein
MRRNLSISGFSEGGGRNQNAIPHHAAENDNVIIAEGFHWHTSAARSMRPLKAS